MKLITVNDDGVTFRAKCCYKRLRRPVAGHRPYADCKPASSRKGVSKVLTRRNARRHFKRFEVESSH